MHASPIADRPTITGSPSMPMTAQPAPSGSAGSGRRSLAKRGAAARQEAFEHMLRLVDRYALSSADLHALYALVRVRELMRAHDITTDDLQAATRAGDPGVPQQQALPSITFCPNAGVDQRVTPLLSGDGAFMADWRQRRGSTS